MINNKTVAVVVPAYNEETQIGIVIETMPDFVDKIIIVNDCSIDNTKEVIENYIKSFKNKIVLINHTQNSGVGGSIATGYKWAAENCFDCTAVMAGDGQMDPDELYSICYPVIYENVDYVKGNRLTHRSALLVIPKVRLIGNSILSILTKIASGYWQISDTQTGYTAISLPALKAINIDKIYKRYGMPNDMLVKLNISMCSLKEVQIKPIYNVGEKSKMKIGVVIPKISFLLVKSFFKRIYFKYLFRNLHPLFFTYHISFLLILACIPIGSKLLVDLFYNNIETNYQSIILLSFSFITGFQSLFFSMWMDIQDNKSLYKI